MRAHAQTTAAAAWTTASAGRASPGRPATAPRAPWRSWRAARRRARCRSSCKPWPRRRAWTTSGAAGSCRRRSGAACRASRPAWANGCATLGHLSTGVKRGPTLLGCALSLGGLISPARCHALEKCCATCCGQNEPGVPGRPACFAHVFPCDCSECLLVTALTGTGANTCSCCTQAFKPHLDPFLEPLFRSLASGHQLCRTAAGACLGALRDWLGPRILAGRLSVAQAAAMAASPDVPPPAGAPDAPYPCWQVRFTILHPCSLPLYCSRMSLE